MSVNQPEPLVGPPVPQPPKKSTDGWHVTFGVCVFIAQHLVIFVAFLAAVCIGAVAMWGAKHVVVLTTGDGERVAECIRWGLEMPVFVTTCVMVLIHSGKEIGKLWTTRVE